MRAQLNANTTHSLLRRRATDCDGALSPQLHHRAAGDAQPAVATNTGRGPRGLFSGKPDTAVRRTTRGTTHKERNYATESSNQIKP